MIIYGTRGIKSTAEKGNFNCPACNAHSPYKKKRVRRFFTLYFIPLIPLDKMGEYVECDTCQATFDPEILTYDPAEESQRIESYFFIACKQVMITMLLADGVIHDGEIKMLQQQFQQISGTFVPEDELREEIAQISQQGVNTQEVLTGLAPSLNDQGKETLVKAAYAIALSDGTSALHPAEEQYLFQLGQILELSNAHMDNYEAIFQLEVKGLCLFWDKLYAKVSLSICL